MFGGFLCPVCAIPARFRRWVVLLGHRTRIPFRSNTLPPSGDGSEWSKNLWLFLKERDRFMGEYHPRSNIESTIGGVRLHILRNCVARVSLPK